MTDTLAPKLNTGGIVPIQPSAQAPSNFSGVASLVSGFLGAIPGPQKPAEVGVGRQQQDGKTRFFREQQRGLALINQGREAEGRSVVTNAARSFYGEFGPDDDVDAAVENTLGVPTVLEQTGSPFDQTEVTASPEFQIRAAAIQAENPNLSPAEVAAGAFNFEVRRRANELELSAIQTQEQINWFDVEENFVQKARDTGTIINSLISDISEDEIITPQEANTLRQQYNEMFGGMTKPVGLNQEDWENYKQSYIDPVTKTVETMISISTTEGLTTDRANFFRSVINKAQSQGKLPAGYNLRLTPEEGSDPWATVTALMKADQATGGRYSEAYNFVLTANDEELINWVTDFSEQTSLNDVLSSATELFDAKSGPAKRESILGDVALIDPVASPGQIAVSITNLNEKFRSVNTGALEPNDFAKVFGQRTFSALEKVFEANPVVGEELIMETISSAESQRVSIGLATRSLANQMGLDIIEGRLVATDNINTIPQVSEAKELVDKYYNGDWNAAISTNASRVPSNRINSRKLVGLRTLVRRVENQLQPRLDRMNRANEIVQRLEDKAFGMIGDVEGGDGQSTAGGGEGEDNLVTDRQLQYRDAIAQIESVGSGEYRAIGATHETLGRALGRYQIMEANIGPWSREALGRTVSAEEFLASDGIQDAIFDFKFGQYVDQFGEENAARAWFGGPGGINNVNATDVHGKLTIGDYGNTFMANLGRTGTPSRRPSSTPTPSSSVAAVDTTGSEERTPLPRFSSVRGAETTPSVAAQLPPIAPQSLTERGRADVEGGNSSEQPTASREQAMRVFNNLAEQTKDLLMKLFGDEESVIAALINGNVPEDVVV